MTLRLWSGRLLLLALSSLFALGLAEFGLRLYLFGSPHLPRSERGLRQPHPVFGWSLRADRQISVRQPDYAVEVKTNSKGLRDVDHAYRPAPGVFRIVVLGDSFMEAYQVELEESLPRRLQQALKDRNVEVVNMGVGGYGTTQELLLLKEEGLKYQPDLVILAFLPSNDIRNNSRELERVLWRTEKDKVFGRPYANINQETGQLEFTVPDFDRMRQWSEDMRDKEENRGYLRRTAIGTQLKHLRKRLTTGRTNRANTLYDPNILFGSLLAEFDPKSGGNRLSPEEYERMWTESWRVTKKVILRMRSLANTHDAEFLLLLAPSKMQVDESYRQAAIARHPTLKFDVAKPNRKLAAFAAAEDVMILDLLPAFRAAREEENVHLFHRQDRHWNAAGHGTAAAELLQFLEKHKLVPQRGRGK